MRPHPEDPPRTPAQRRTPIAATRCQRLGGNGGEAAIASKVRRHSRRSTWPAARGDGLRSLKRRARNCRFAEMTVLAKACHSNGSMRCMRRPVPRRPNWTSYVLKRPYRFFARSDESETEESVPERGYQVEQTVCFSNSTRRCPRQSSTGFSAPVQLSGFESGLQGKTTKTSGGGKA